MHQRKGRYGEARSDLEQALALLEASSPAHPDTVTALTPLGDQLTMDGDLLRGRELLTRAVSLASVVLPTAHPDTAAAWQAWPPTCRSSEISESQQLRQRAVDIAQKVFGANHPMLAIRLNDLANVSLFRGTM